MNMKVLAIILNCLGIAVSIYLYQHYQIIEPLYISGFFGLTLIILTGLGNKGMALIVMILSVCSICGSVVFAGILFFSGLAGNYPLPLMTVLLLIPAFVFIAVINIFSLKPLAGIKNQDIPS